MEQQVTVRPSRSVEIALVQSVAVFGIHMSGVVGQLIRVMYVLEYDQVLGITRYVTAEATLVEQILRDEYYTDVRVMTALGRERTRTSSRFR